MLLDQNLAWIFRTLASGASVEDGLANTHLPLFCLPRFFWGGICLPALRRWFVSWAIFMDLRYFITRKVPCSIVQRHGLKQMSNVLFAAIQCSISVFWSFPVLESSFMNSDLYLLRLGPAHPSLVTFEIKRSCEPMSRISHTDSVQPFTLLLILLNSSFLEVNKQ